MSKQQPQWQPIGMLPVFTDMVDGMLQSSEEQLVNLHAAKDRPHVFDNEMLNRIIELYNNQIEDAWLFEQQFTRWKKGNLTDAEKREVDRLAAQSSKITTTNKEILKIAHSIEHATIDEIVGMDELELLDALVSGKIKPPV